MQVVGLDIGTSTICAIVFDYDNKSTESILRSNDAYIVCGNEWEKTQDPERILTIVKEILNIILLKYKEIKGIGITGQMHGIMYLDRFGEPISKFISWQDGRGNLTYKNSMSYADYLTEISGYSLSTGFGLVSHYYNMVNKLVPSGAVKICTIMDYVGMKLTKNKYPISDPSNSASLGVFNLKDLKFDYDILERLNIDTQILPKIVTDNRIIGYFNDNIPVFPAIGDNQAGFLGSIKDIDKSILINVGTSGQLSVFTKEYLKIKKLDIRPFPGGGYILVGASLCGGNSLSLLKGLFNKTIEMFYDLKLEDDVFFKVANTIDLSLFNNKNNLLIETLFAGTRYDPDQRGTIKNISLDNLTPQELIVGFFKGVCNELFEYYKLLPESLSDKKISLIGSGNAVRRNRLLCQCLETIFKNKLMIPKHKEEAAFGACLLVVASIVYNNKFDQVGNHIDLNNISPF